MSEPDAVYAPPATKPNSLPSFWAILLLTALVAVIPVAIKSTLAFFSTQTAILGAAAKYDATYDPLLIEHGHLRVLGPRWIFIKTPELRITVDPTDTAPAEFSPEIGLDVFVSATSVSITERNQRREFPLLGIQQALGADPLRIDSAGLSALWYRGRLFYGLILGGIVIFVGGFIWFALLAQALAIASFVTFAFRRRVSYSVAFQTALLASLAPELLLALVGDYVWNPGFIVSSALGVLLTLPLAWWLTSTQVVAEPSFDAPGCPSDGHKTR